MKLFAWFAGVDPERLAAHRCTSRYLVIAMGMVLVLVTGPIVALAMGSYVYQSLPVSIGIAFRVFISVCFGAAWMAIIWTIDRALMLSSDSIGSGHRTLMAFGLVLRFALAGILASIFANQLIQLLYSDILNTTAQHLALDLREADAKRLEQLHGVPGAQKAVGSLETAASGLTEQYKELPAWILEKLNVAERCEKQARQFANQVSRWPTPDAWRALARKNAICHRLRSDATHNRDAYLDEISRKIQDNNERLEKARAQAALTMIRFQADRAILDESIGSGYGSLSARDLAFEKLTSDHPEVRTNARLWWAALLMLELLPILLKMMCRNNPVGAEAQANLAEDAARHRIRIRRLEALESRLPHVLIREDVRDTIDSVAAEYTVAMSRLAGFHQLIERLVDEIRNQRHFSRAFPDFASRADAAFTDVITRAFDSLGRETEFRAAAE